MTEDPKFERKSPWQQYQERKAAAQKEGYTGRFWSRDWQPKGTKPIWYSPSVENPNITYWKPDELARGRADLPNAQYDSTKEQQSYWDDPKAVGRWYDFLSVQDDDYVPPDWMDVDSIKSLYKELKSYNDSEDWQNWQPLPFGSIANYQAQMMPYPFGVNPNQPSQSRKKSLYEQRLPTIMGNLADVIDQYNVNMTELQKQDAVTYKNYLTSLEPLKQYNLTMERIKEIDPEMYEELGGQIDVNKLSEADFQMPTTADELPDYASMEKWAQFLLMFTSAGEMKNRPEWTRKVAAGTQGLMAGIASGAIAAGATAPIATALAIPSGGVSLLVPVVGFVIGTVVGMAQYQSAISGVNNPVIQKPMRLLGILDEWTEQLIGFTDIAVRGEGEMNLGAAWKAGSLAYESGVFPAGDWLTDFVSKTAHIIDPDNNSGYTTEAGQVWQLHKGLDTPQNTEYWGAKTLQLVHDEIMTLGEDATKEDIDLVLAKWIDRYGYSGNLNNFLGQLLISPTNFIPAGVNAAMLKAAPKLSKYYHVKANMADDFVSKIKFENLARTADDLSTPQMAEWAKGNLITDAMPMGVQQVFEGIMTGKYLGKNLGGKVGNLPIAGSNFADFWKGTQSPFNVLTMATAMKNSGWNLAMADAARLAKFPLQDIDGNVIAKGSVDLETITMKDPTYTMKGDDGIEYTISKADDSVVKASKDGTDVTISKPLKAGVDAELKLKVNDLINDITLKQDIGEYEKVMAGADTAKIPERLKGTSVVKTLNNLVSLTPSSQVMQTSRYTMEALKNIVYLSGGDAKKTGEIIRYMADRTDVPGIGEAAKQFASGNVMTHAWRVFKEYVKTGGSFDDLLKMWETSTTRRMELNGLAKRLNMSVTDMVKKMTAPEVWDAIKKIDPELANAKSADAIADLMKPYKTKVPLPLTDAEFVSKLTVDMLENTEKFLIEHYDVKPLSAASRFSNILKSALGVGVITANVPVWITNFLTNEVCVSLFVGSSTLTPKSAIADFFTTVGIDPGSLWDVDFGLSGDIVKASGDLYTALNPPNAFGSKALRGVQNFNKKIPVIGELYGKIEKFSKGRAGYGAFKDSMRMPLSDAMPDVQVEFSKYLNPSELKAFNRAVNNAKSAEQLDAAFGQTITYRPLMEDAIEKALYDTTNGDPSMKPLIEDLVTKTGLVDWVRENLSKALTPEDFETYRLAFWNEVKKQADVLRGQEMLAKVEEIRNNPEGAINLLNVSGENGVYEFSTQIAVNRIWGEAMDRIRLANKTKNKGLASMIYESTRAQANDIYSDMFAYLKTTTRAAIEKAGVGEYADRMVIILDTLSKDNARFFVELDDIRMKQRDNLDASIDYDKLIVDRTELWRNGQEASLQKQAELWVEMLTKSESSTNGLKGDELRATAQKFMDNYLKKRKELRKLVDDHYKSVENKTWAAKADDDFWVKVYQPKVAEIRSLFVDGYYDKFFRITRTKETGTPNAVTPRTPTQVAIDQLRANIIRIESLPDAKNAHQWALDTSTKAVLERMVQESKPVSDRAKRFVEKMDAGTSHFLPRRYRKMSVDEVIKIAGDTNLSDRSPEYVEEMRQSIIKDGIKEPIKLVSKPNGDLGFEDGMHRLLIAKELGIKEVPVWIRNVDDPISAWEIPFDDEILYVAKELGVWDYGKSSAIELAKKIQDKVHEPAITLSPEQQKAWDKLQNKQLELPFDKPVKVDENIDIGTSIADVMKVAIDKQQGAAIDLAKKLFALKDATTDEALIKQIDTALVTLNDLVKTPEGVEQTEQPAITPYPLASQPQAIPTSRGWLEVVNHQLQPVMNRIFDNFEKTIGQTQETSFKLGDQLVNSPVMKGQLERWKTDLQMKVSTSMDYAKLMTDSTLLNYTEKTGMDMLLQNFFPFHFWYTHSIGEWAKHILSKPSIYATYAKWQQLKERNGLKLPTRMAGKLRIPVPFLPDWAGDAMFINPTSKFFPIESLMQPLSNLADLSKTVNDQVISQINKMVIAELISEDQAREAIQSGQGQIWESALATVQTQNPDTLDPMSAVSWSMQPAPWFTIPYYALTGQSEKNSLYPLTRQGQAWAAQGRNIGGVGGGILETVGELLSLPEVKIREIAGLSPYGEFGDYYIEFMLSNMATEPGVDTDAIIRAMLEKKGDLWDAAKQRADEYLSYRMPGSAMMQVIASGDLEYLAPAFLVTAFPAGLYPVGELKQRGLYNTYQSAWDKFVMGDTEAMKNFYNENPEYEARLALFKEPEERLHSHLINMVWDQYTALSDPDKKLVQEQFGESFKVYFLDTKTRNYEKVDNDTLAYWGRQLKGQVPETPETQAALTRTLEPMEMYKPDVAQSAQVFLDLRKQQFPNYYWMQNLYYAIPEGDRQAFLRGFPELKNYWDWKDEYIEANPLVGVYLDDQKARYVGSDATDYAWALAEQPNDDLIKGFDAELALAVGMYALGNPLSEGAKAELTRIWTGLGRPGGNFDIWLKAYLGL